MQPSKSKSGFIHQRNKRVELKTINPSHVFVKDWGVVETIDCNAYLSIRQIQNLIWVNYIINIDFFIYIRFLAR